MLTIAYVRVSTDDQVEHSPDAQRRRCGNYAQTKDIGPVRFLSDEGWSGKNLERPAIQELIELIKTEQVAHLIVWRLDRLSRDSSDLSLLIRRLEQHCVSLHSINEGQVEVETASGRMQAGIHGVFAQYFREQNIENIHLGNEQAVRSGYWINRPPTGYDLVNRVLIPIDDAHLIQRIFAQRATGSSYPELAQSTGLNYSTVRHICQNRVYLGLTHLRDRWFDGRHEPLVTEAEFEAAQRAHVPGRRRGSDLLSGRVRCGECGRRDSIDTNGRGSPIYRCKHRGKGCSIPGRSATGLHRAARLGIDLLSSDADLVDAIRYQRQVFDLLITESARRTSQANRRRKRDKLFQLCLDDQITAEYFATQEKTLSAKIGAIEDDHAEATQEQSKRSILADAFEQAISLLQDPLFDLETVWDNASQKEPRVLVEELIEAVTIHEDRLAVTVTGFPHCW